MQRFILENQGSIRRKLVKPGSKDQRHSSVLSNRNAAMPPMTKTSMVARESLLRLLNLGRLLGNCGSARSRSKHGATLGKSFSLYIVGRDRMDQGFWKEGEGWGPGLGCGVFGGYRAHESPHGKERF
jgi:hypothetical protein